jgi:two-component system chemotaxis response regulator CheB
VTPTTILICDDSRTYATALRILLEQDGRFQVVGISPSGEHALEAVARLRPALVTMDLELPGIDGVEATRQIMHRHPVPVVVLSAHAHNGSEKAAAALAAGAVEAMPKTKLRVGDPSSHAASTLRRRLELLAQAHVKPTATRRSQIRTRRPSLAHHEAVAVGIGSSTGGPRALRSVLSELPMDFALPVLVVQHIGGEFLGALARWLDSEIPLPVRIAADRTVLGPGVWLAPGDSHLTVDRALRVTLDRDTPVGLHRPAADMLLESMATAFGTNAVGVVLTGMGVDGARGVAAIAAAGGLVIAQDEASSVVYGMPRAAAEQGADVLALGEIAPALRALRQLPAGS